MANGVAPSFNDRRGQNPFQPVQVARPKTRVHAAVTFGGDSYIGRGVTSPNGALPPRVINGKTYTRDNPDVAGLRRRQLEIGEKRSNL